MLFLTHILKKIFQSCFPLTNSVFLYFVYDLYLWLWVFKIYKRKLNSSTAAPKFRGAEISLLNPRIFYSSLITQSFFQVVETQSNPKGSIGLPYLLLVHDSLKGTTGHRKEHRSSTRCSRRHSYITIKTDP